MRRLTKILLLCAMILLFMSATAFATIIDFRTFNPGSDGDHKVSSPYSNTVNGLTITFSFSPTNQESFLWWDSTDGFGVWASAGYERDEIETLEILRINFSKTVYVSCFELTDLFYEQRNNKWYYEKGKYSLDNGDSWINFVQNDETIKPSPASNGEFALVIDDYVNSIFFTAPGKTNDEDHEFSVAAVSVPEPSTLLLVGFGLIGLAGLGRRKFFKKS